ncbi:unnamed protein product, partial [Prorocentrum cordatum]
ANDASWPQLRPGLARRAGQRETSYRCAASASGSGAGTIHGIQPAAGASVRRTGQGCSAARIIEFVLNLSIILSQVVEYCQSLLFQVVESCRNFHTMADGAFQGGGDGYSLIPVWHGAPQGWRRYGDGVKIWALGTSLDVNCCVTALLVSKLKGTARQAADNVRGTNNVLLALEAAFNPQQAVRRGESKGEFFESQRYNRRSGERITDFIPRFEEGLQRLEDVGVQFADEDDVLGWWFLKKCTLNAERHEQVVAALRDEKYRFTHVKKIVARLFPNLHVNEPRRLPPPGFLRDEVATVDSSTEVDSKAEGQGDDEECDEANEVNADQVSDVQGFVRHELEALAAEIEESQIDLPTEQTTALEEAALQESQLPEAVEIIRDAREKLSRKGGRGKGRGRDLADKLKERKKKSTCKACGKTGRWAGDPEYKAPAERGAWITAASDGDSDSACEAPAVHSAGIPLPRIEEEVLRSQLIRMVKDHLRNAVDTAYLEVLKELGLDELVECETVIEKFRLGDGGTLMSCEAFRFPAVVAGTPVHVQAIGADIDVGRKRLSVGSGSQFLLDSENKHFALELKPEKFTALKEAYEGKEELPPKLAQNARPAPRSAGRMGSCVLKICTIAASMCSGKADPCATTSAGRLEGQ